jgi:signal transduction histidine kinase
MRLHREVFLVASRVFPHPALPFVHPDDVPVLQQLLEERQVQTSEGEVRLRKGDNSALAARLSLTARSRDRSVAGILITDLTTEKENAGLASRIQRLQDEERRNMARELHDSVGQLLAAITMSLASARTEASKSNDSVAAMLDDSSVMIAQVSKEIRTISHLLHPPLLDVGSVRPFAGMLTDSPNAATSKSISI